jgi:hypothetical protein
VLLKYTFKEGYLWNIWKKTHYNKTARIATIAALLVVVAFIGINSANQSVLARSSIIGSYSDGYEAGKAASVPGGDSSCPNSESHSTSYCVGYVAGYELVKGSHFFGRILNNFK